MLDLYRRFTLITGPEYQDEFVEKLKWLYVTVEETHYMMNPQCTKIVKVIFDCRVPAHRFDEAVECLEIVFKKDWAQLIY